MGGAHDIAPAVGFLKPEESLGVGIFSPAEAVDEIQTVASKILPQDRQLLSMGLPGVVDEGSEQFDPTEPLEGLPREGLQVRLARRAPSVTPDGGRKLASMIEINPGVRFGLVDRRSACRRVEVKSALLVAPSRRLTGWRWASVVVGAEVVVS